MTTTLQSLINEHGKILEEVEQAEIKLDEGKITVEQFNVLQEKEEKFPNRELPPSLQNEFDEYKKVCFVEYENKIQSLIQYFQFKENNPEELLKELKSSSKLDETDSQISMLTEKILFENFFEKEKEINEYLQSKKIELPQNLKQVYVNFGEGIEQEYTNWLIENNTVDNSKKNKL